MRILQLHAEPDASEVQHRGRNKVPGSSERQAALCMCNYYTNLTSVLQASKLEIWGGIQAEASDINIICRTALQS